MQEHIRQELMKEIPITAFPGIRIGQVENAEAGTGCTAFLSPEGMRAGLDVRGGGPASRESQLLNPLMAAQKITTMPTVPVRRVLRRLHWRMRLWRVPLAILLAELPARLLLPVLVRVVAIHPVPRAKGPVCPVLCPAAVTLFPN